MSDAPTETSAATDATAPAVVADTGPLRYLVVIDQISILPDVVGRVVITEDVRAELDQPAAPEAVRSWVAALPSWLTVRSVPSLVDPALVRLDVGERTTIALAVAIGADAVSMDDRAGVTAARQKGLIVFGTLGLLDKAARRGLIDLEEAFARLRGTNFRYSADLLETLLEGYRRDGGPCNEP